MSSTMIAVLTAVGTLVWIACCIASFMIMASAWRFKWDLTRSDARGMAFMSVLGPVSLVTAVLIYWTEKPSNKPDPVIWPRKPPAPALPTAQED